MKKTFLFFALLFSGFLLKTASAQVNVNIGSQPLWGPVGYDHVEYYYMPDIDSYYYVPKRQYIYLQNGNWITSSYLPSSYNYNVSKGYKVVVNDPFPYRNAEMYRVKYAGFKNNHSQQIIRNSREEKYFIVKGHPEHYKYKNGNNGNGNSNGKGIGNGKGNSGKAKGNGTVNKKGNKGHH